MHWLLAALLTMAVAVLLYVQFGGKTTSAAARQLVADGAALVDVRSPAEFAASHLPGAKNIPVGELASRFAELSKDQPVVLYCASGMRSAAAARTLRGLGFTRVHDLGGMSRW